MLLVRGKHWLKSWLNGSNWAKSRVTAAHREALACCHERAAPVTPASCSPGRRLLARLIPWWMWTAGFWWDCLYLQKCKECVSNELETLPQVESKVISYTNSPCAIRWVGIRGANLREGCLCLQKCKALRRPFAGWPLPVLPCSQLLSYRRCLPPIYQPRQVTIQLLQPIGEAEPPEAEADVTITKAEAGAEQEQHTLFGHQPIAEIPRRPAAQADEGHRPDLGLVPAKDGSPVREERFRQRQEV